MPIVGQVAVKLKPAGICDAFDSTELFLGASIKMSNLIFDQGNPECGVPRPGVGVSVLTAAQIQTQIGSGTATFISGHIGIGTTVYGMVSMSGGTFNGLDVPFAYNFNTGTFLPITGIAAGSSPLSPLTTGPWNPPTFAVIGIYLIVTHPGWNGVGANFFGALNLSTNAWTVQNLLTNALPSPPIAVANFNNRGYFAIGNQSFYSDSLNPLKATNAGQVLTHGDNSPIVGYVGLPVTTSTGGVVQQLLVVKPASIWFVTGDAAIANTLATNFLSTTLGCSAPRTLVQAPQGVYMIGTDGAMLVDQLGIVKKVTHRGSPESDIRVPFVNAQVPSRLAGAFASNIYRVFVPNTIIQGNTVNNDYWFDTIRERWNGPHSFAYDCASQLGSYFLLSGSATGANLFQSNPTPTATSIYTDNGNAFNCEWQSADFPKTGKPNGQEIVESTQELGGPSIPFNIAILDDSGDVLSSCLIKTPAAGITWDSGPLWDGGAKYATSITVPSTFTVPWTNPVVAPKFQIDITAAATAGMIIGAHMSKHKDTGYQVAQTSS